MAGKKDIFAADIFKAGIFKAGIVAGGGAPLPVGGGAIKNNPGCPCCEELTVCQILADPITSVASINNYTVSDPAEVYFDTDNITIVGPDESAVTVIKDDDFPFPAKVFSTVFGYDGSKIRLLISWGDDYGLIAELTTKLTCGELRLFQVESGVETLIGGAWAAPGAINAVQHQFNVCYDPELENLTVFVEPGGLDPIVTQHTVKVVGHVPQQQAGMASGSGTSRFIEFNWNRLWYEEEGERVSCGQCGSTDCYFFRPSMQGDAVDCDFIGDTEDWSTATGYLESLTALSEIWSTTPAPVIDGDEGFFVHFRFTAAEAGRVLQMRFNASEDKTLWNAIEITTGYGVNETCGKLRLIDQDDTLIAEEHIVYGVKPGDYLWCRFIYDSGHVWAMIWNATGNDIHVISTDPEVPIVFNGGYVGIALTSGTGSLKFSELYGIQEVEGSCALPTIPWCKVDEGGFGSLGKEEVWPDNYSIELGNPTIEAHLPGSEDMRVISTDDTIVHRLAPVPGHSVDDYKLNCLIGRTGFELGTGRSAAGVILGSDGSGNNHYEVRVSPVDSGGSQENYRLGIYRIEGGVETLLTYDNTWFLPTVTDPDLEQDGGNFDICWNNGTIECTMYFATFGNDSYWATVSYGGLTAYGNLVGMTAKPFTECVATSIWLWAPRRIDTVNPQLNPCEPCLDTCASCVNNNAPLEIMVELRGWVGCNCDVCDDAVNRDFYLPFDIGSTDELAGFCGWGDSIDVPYDCEGTVPAKGVVQIKVWIASEDGKIAIYGTVTPKLTPGYAGPTGRTFDFKRVTSVPSGDTIDCYTYLDGLELFYAGESHGCGGLTDGYCTPQLDDPYDGSPGPITGTMVMRVVS